MKAVELFAGAGGLGMGLSLAGFKPQAVVEWDRDACETLRKNQLRGFPLVRDWPLREGDVRDWIAEFSPSRTGMDIDLVAGGPPCQPFSLGGKHGAFDDRRDMFPVAVEVVRRIRPRSFIFENVRGLTRPAFHNYFQYIKLQLEFPEVVRPADWSWADHFHHLQQVKSARGGPIGGLTYNVQSHLVNAANFGVPQRRERVFIVGFRSDLGVKWDMPRETHSLDGLLYDQWVTGSYWARHRIPSRLRPEVPASYRDVVNRMGGLRLTPSQAPWRTVKDGLEGLTDPELRELPSIQHRLQPGARSYAGHTGSPLHLPAKTLKAGDHGVPGGENMLVKSDGEVRYFTVRESARLQTFPDGFMFRGSWTESMRQLGNAVPVSLAHVVAASVAERLIESRMRELASVATRRVAG
jgi:DNA (cytosine-5)-methyltransferase 1